MSTIYFNLIQNAETAALDGKTFESRNPADQDDIIGKFPCSGVGDVDKAVVSARSCLTEWSSCTPPTRARVLFRAAEILHERKEQIADLIVREMGKTKKESLGDVQSAIDMAQFCAGEGRRLYGVTTFSELPSRHAETRRISVGVCALITPWNAPVAAPSWKVFPALICGNTVVLKPAEDTPACADAFVRVLIDAGLPAGACNLIHGIGEETGAALVRHPDIDLVSFTGSTEVGTDINKACAERHRKVSLELGGKNGLLVLQDADLDHAVSCIVSGAFSIAGQRCAATSRIIVHESVANKLKEKLLIAAAALIIGPGTDADTQVCPLINKKQLERVVSYVEIGQFEGAEIIAGGHVLNEGACARGLYHEPTIFWNVKPDMRIAREEIFGPVVSAITCKNVEDGIRLMNDSPYGLTASVFTRDVNMAMRAVDAIRAGVVYVNAPTFGSEVHLPFGGFGKSGNGHREAGMGGMDVFSEWKTIYVDYSGKWQNAQFTKFKI